MIQHKHIISFAMAHNVCDGKGDCGMPCVMGNWIAQLNCQPGQKSHT